MKRWFFEKINKIGKLLTNQPKEREKTLKPETKREALQQTPRRFRDSWDIL